MHAIQNTRQVTNMYRQLTNMHHCMSMSTTTDNPIVAAVALSCDTNLDMDIDDPSELKATHDVGCI